MRATTGFPSMETLYICIYSSTMASTALHPNLFIPAFAEICVNIAFVATFMNEYISYFESCSLIKKVFLTCMTSHQKKLPISIFMPWRSPLLVYFQCSSKLHRIYILGTSRLTYWCPARILLLLEISQPLPIFLYMWLIHHHLRFLLLLLIWVILILYWYQDLCYHIHMILGSLHVHPSPCIILQQYLPQFILQALFQVFLHHILRLHSLSCCTKRVFLLPTQTLDIGQRWVVF